MLMLSDIIALVIFYGIGWIGSFMLLITCSYIFSTIYHELKLEVLANVDENGELPVQTINGKQVKPTVEQMLKTYSIAATNELYPQGSYSERQRIQYQNDMYNAMLALYNRYLNYQK